MLRYHVHKDVPLAGRFPIYNSKASSIISIPLFNFSF